MDGRSTSTKGLYAPVEAALVEIVEGTVQQQELLLSFLLLLFSCFIFVFLSFSVITNLTQHGRKQIINQVVVFIVLLCFCVCTHLLFCDLLCFPMLGCASLYLAISSYALPCCAVLCLAVLRCASLSLAVPCCVCMYRYLYVCMQCWQVGGQPCPSPNVCLLL